MKIINYNKTLFSFEILPTLSGENFKSIIHIMQYNPFFITITYHLVRCIYNIINKIYNYCLSNRKGTIAICSSISNKFHIEIIPHIIVSGCSNHIMENYLIDLNYLGINNVFIIRGDIFNNNIYSLDIVKKISHFMKFCIGVAGYPEKNLYSPSLEVDILYFKKKILSGANYIITQMFFDNSKFFHFLSLCRSVGIEIPIIPSLKIITWKYQINTISYKFNLNMPNELLREIHYAKNFVTEIGIEWAINQSIELKKTGVPVIHYYTLNRYDHINQILKEVF
jgi:methylenetetrahydrofolate reductase (NADPH)